MKTRVFVSYAFLVLLILSLAVLLLLQKPPIKMTGNAIYSPPAIVCTNESIKAVWDSIFVESSINIIINKNDSSGQCYFVAYKNNSGDVYGLSRFNFFVDTLEAWKIKLAPEGVNFYLSSISNGSSFFDTNLYTINRSISSISQARTEFESTFKIIPSAFEYHGDAYSFENTSYSVINGLNISNKVDGLIWQNISLNIFQFSTFSGACFSAWHQINSSCGADDSLISWYNDTNQCGIESNSTYSNKTIDCDYGNNGVIGNESSIDADNLNIDFHINGSAYNSSLVLNSMNLVELKEGNITRVIFNHNFSVPLNLKQISIKKQSSSYDYGYLIVSGIDENKNVTLDSINSTDNSLCVKDQQINSISEVSNNCSSSNEYLLSCPGTNSSFSCIIQGNDSFYVSGLAHSAVKEIPAENNSTSCTPSWNCTDWSPCSNGFQNRTCTDLTNCTSSNSRIEDRTCSISCTPSWNCTDWSPCSANLTKTRSCTDINNCNSQLSKPEQTTACTYEDKDKMILIYIAIFVLAVIMLVILGIIISYFLQKKPVGSPSNPPSLSEIDYQK